MAAELSIVEPEDEPTGFYLRRPFSALSIRKPPHP
jgi:hypothetical protein